MNIELLQCGTDFTCTSFLMKNGDGMNALLEYRSTLIYII